MDVATETEPMTTERMAELRRLVVMPPSPGVIPMAPLLGEALDEVERLTSQRCATCSHWEPSTDDGSDGECDRITVWSGRGAPHATPLMTRPDFGCNGHEVARAEA